MRPEQVIRIGGEEGATAAEMMTLWDLESSQGTNKAARNDFQVTKTAFKEVMPEGDFTNPEDVTRAAARYFMKQKAAQGGSTFAAFAGYNGGPNWQGTMQDPAALARHKELNAGSTPVDYASNAETVRRRYETQFPSEASIQVASYDPLGPKGVAGSDRFLPTKQSTSDILKNLYTDLTSTMQTLKEHAATFDIQADSIAKDFAENTIEHIGAAEATGAAKANVVLASQVVDAKMGADAARTLADANVNTTDVNSQLAHNLREMAGFQRQAEELRSRIQANSVDFLEDPVKWVQNLIDMPPLVRRHNQALYNYQTTKEQTDGMIGTAHNANVANNAKRATIADAEASAKASLALADASQTVAAIKEKEISTNWQILALKQQRDTTLIHNQTQIAETLLRQTDVEQQQLGRQLAAQAEADSVKMAHDAGTQIGWNVNSRKDIQEMPARMRERLLNAMNTGTFGANAIEAYETVSAGDRNIMPPTTSSLLPFVTKLYRTGNEEVQKKAITFTSQADKRTALNQTMLDTAQKFHDDVHLGDSQIVNPYAAPSAQEMIAQPEIQKLQIGKILQESMKQAPAMQLDDKQIIALVKDGFTKGTSYSDIQQAAQDLVRYYQKAVKVNSTAHNFYAFRLPEQENYIFAPDGGQKVDFTNYGQVLQYLIKGAKQSIRDRITEAGIEGFQSAILP